VASILVTGATGFFGSHLVRALRLDGHQVLILKRRQSSLKRIADICDDVTLFNIEDVDLDRIFSEKRVDTIIHCATSYGRDEKSIYEVYQTNVEWSMKLLNLAAKFSVASFLNIDSYLNKNLNNCPYLSEYVLSKRHFMEWGSQYAKKIGIQFINIKLEHLYGPGDSGSKFVPWLIAQCSDGRSEVRLTPGEQLRDFLYVSDAVNALSCLVNNRDKLDHVYEEVGLGTGIATSIKKFSIIVHRLTKSQSELAFGALPYRSGELMHSCAANHRLVELGWQPLISLEEGLTRTIFSNALENNGLSNV
jgi:nucleoside-diphosphate-sugar epimerase